MSAPLFLVAPGSLTAVRPGDPVELSGAEGHHAAAVMRLAVGEPIDLADGRGTVVRGVVASLLGRDRLSVRVIEVAVEAPPSPRIVVVQALPKGDRGQVAVETLTEVGVDVIVPWAARRCVVQWSADRAEKGRAKWAATARAAAKQSRRSWQPEVTAPASTDQVAQLVREASLALVLHEDGALSLRDLGVVPPAGDVVIVVGPEGGIAPEELDVLAAAGGQVVRMGPSVMRTSTAGTVAAGILLARTDRWA